MQTQHSLPASCQETLEALVRYLARCAAETDDRSAPQPQTAKELPQ